MNIRKALKASADAKNLRLGKTIHAHLIASNQISRNPLILKNSLINLYSKCGDIPSALNVFDGMCEKNIVSWCAVMVGYLRQGHSLQVIQLCRNMVIVDKLRPNEFTLSMVLSSCSNCGLLHEGQQCHGYGLKSGLIYYPAVKNALVYMYSTCADMQVAMRALDTGPRSDICTYSSIINGSLVETNLTLALSVLQRLVDECKYDEWDGITCVSVIGVCGRLKDPILGRQVHGKALKTGVDCDLFVGSATVDMYGKCGQISSMREVFNTLAAKNEVTWTAVLTAYSHNEFHEEALKLFVEMDAIDTVAPNKCTYSVVLNSCAGISAVGFGNSLHTRVTKIGMKTHSHVGNALIHMCSRCGLIEDARDVFTEMPHRDAVSWNLMINGFSCHGLGRAALDTFGDMLSEQMQPSYVTFVGVLSACALLGRADDGFHYLNSMKARFGVEPGLEHYTCMVGLLGRAGRLEEAERFMVSSPVKWDVVAWRTLLNACHVHKDYTLGRRVASIVLGMKPGDTGACILISNMHARARRWDRVAVVRRLMREGKLKKEPGLSWTEIKDETHVFVSGENEHAEWCEIQEKVGELVSGIKEMGYVPDGCFSELRDVEEEQKEEELRYHSEKLAIAYALMRTAEGATVRVMKNVRMCEDCHAAAKLISRLVGRRIVVRDVNRFHSFSHGQCSCDDYW